jgi:hypothetical protein
VTTSTQNRWWTIDGDAIGNAAFAYVERLEGQQAWVSWCNRLNERLYTNRAVDGSSPAYAQLLGQDVPIASENVLAAVCDTATALIASNKPKPSVQTDGGEWSAQRAAKDLEQFLLGMFEEHKVYIKGKQVVRGATVYGTDGLKIFAENSKVKVDRINIDDIIVDELEARLTSPRQIHHRRFVDRDVLKTIYPGKAKEIDNADASYGPNRRGRARNDVANAIPIIESWHLRSSEKAKDGKYVVSIKGALLEQDEYTKDYFPFVFYRWQDPLRGFYGVGIVELLAQLQMDLNEILQFIKECQRLIIAPRVYGDFGPKLPDQALTNEIGLYINTRGGKAPVFYTPQALNAETYNQRAYFVERMFSLAGVSEMQARARKEPGIESGVAMREMNDVQSGRFALQAQAAEQFYLEVAQHLVWLVEDLAGEQGTVKVTYRDRNAMRTIDWKEVKLSQGDYTMSIEAASLLGHTPAGRLERALDLLKAGAIDVSSFRGLIDHPDTDRVLEEMDAPRKDIEALLEKLAKGEWEAPDPFMDLNLGVSMVTKECRRISRKGAPEEVTDLHHRWVDEALALIKQAAPPAPPPGPMGPGMPPGPPGPGMMPPGAGNVIQPIAPPPPMPGIG